MAWRRLCKTIMPNRETIQFEQSTIKIDRLEAYLKIPHQYFCQHKQLEESVRRFRTSSFAESLRPTSASAIPPNQMPLIVKYTQKVQIMTTTKKPTNQSRIVY